MTGRDKTQAALRALKKAALVLLGSVLLVAAAWTASNSFDSAPSEVPGPLRMPAKSVADEQNSFFALIGLRAPAGQDSAVAGLRRWRSPPEEGKKSNGIAVPSGAPLDCGSAAIDCEAQWLASASALRDQLSHHEELGRRCESVVAAGARFEELLPDEDEPDKFLQRLAPHMLGASTCAKWFLARAAIAADQGDRAQVALWLGRSSILDRALLQGSHTLIAHAVAWSVARRCLRTAAAIVAAHPDMVDAARALAAPLPVEARDPARWMSTEALYGRVMVDLLRQQCNRPRDEGELGWAGRLWCATRIGLLPNVTKADSDARWLQALSATHQGLAAALNRPPFSRMNAERPRLAWRNTFGRLLLDVGADSYATYLARQLDLYAHHAAFQLALNMTRAEVPASDRSAWLAQQVVDVRMLRNLRVEGDVLLADDFSSATRATARVQDRIRIPLATAKGRPIVTNITPSHVAQ